MLTLILKTKGTVFCNNQRIMSKYKEKTIFSLYILSQAYSHEIPHYFLNVIKEPNIWDCICKRYLSIPAF